MSKSSQTVNDDGFTVGICATGAPATLGQLVETILSECQLTPLKFRRLVVVASECSEPVVSELRRIRERDARVHLIVESARQGKANAINKIMARADGDLLVLVNSDASPERGAISRLLSEAGSDPLVGAISAMPVTEKRSGPTSLLVDLMWNTHNESSITLNHMNLSNHSCDELVVFRLSAISALPRGLVNDGAFLAATVRRGGFLVKVCPSAKVRIETPTRISDVIRQRRRILFGHAQVWRKTGHPPKTLESLLFLSPPIGLRLLVGTLAKHPRFLLALPLAFLSELSASLLSIYDASRSSKMHAVWRRFN